MSATKEFPPLEVLLVEDNLADVTLTKKALERSGCPYHLTVVRDGKAALELLMPAGGPRGYRPELVLLDLDLPQRDGREVLAEIKGDEGLRRIPVVVLTTSGAESDVKRAYQSQANGFVVKPMDVREFMKAIQVVVSFWAARRWTDE